MRIPTRCNKRSCQARRNLSKMPDQYIRPPRCHMVGCDGFMYVDKYRLRKGPKDNAPVCTDATCPYHYANSTDSVMPHRVSTRGCSGYAEYVTKRNTSPRSKHSPIPVDEWVPF